MNTCLEGPGASFKLNKLFTSIDISCFLISCVLLSFCIFEYEHLCSLWHKFSPPSSSEKSKFSNAFGTYSNHGNDHLGYKFMFMISQKEEL